MTSKAIATTKENGLAVAPAWAKLPDENRASGVDMSAERGESYFGSYDWRMRLNGSKFEVFKGEGIDRVVVEAYNKNQIFATILYAHPVYKLLAGSVKGLTTDSKTWAEEDRQIVASVYGNPFGADARRGTFDVNGFSKYLDDKELRKKVEKRIYLFLLLPQVTGENPIIAASFSGTSLFNFYEYLRELDKLQDGRGFATSMIWTKFLTEARELNGKAFTSVKFEVGTKDGSVAFSAPTPAEYEAKILPWVNVARSRHENFLAGRASAPAEVLAAAADDSTDEDVPW